MGPRGPRREPRQARALATVDAILEASTRVFDRRGFQHTTTNDIADVAGVSVGSLYQYFPDKVSLLTALHERHVETVASGMLQAMHLARATDQGVGPALAAVVRRCLQAHRQHPRLQRLLHEQLPQVAPSPADSGATLRLGRTVGGWLQARNAGLSDQGAGLVSATLLTMGESLVHAAVLAPPEGLGEAALEENITRALQGYLQAQGLR